MYQLKNLAHFYTPKHLWNCELNQIKIWNRYKYNGRLARDYLSFMLLKDKLKWEKIYARIACNFKAVKILALRFSINRTTLSVFVRSFPFCVRPLPHPLSFPPSCCYAKLWTWYFDKCNRKGTGRRKLKWSQ